MVDNNTCKEHSGFKSRIETVEKENSEQWKGLKEMDSRINSIFTRINIILGGVIVACVMLVINFLIQFSMKG